MIPYYSSSLYIGDVSSTSPPGGNQVDGLPPASSFFDACFEDGSEVMCLFSKRLIFLSTMGHLPAAGKG